jgi:hypothetical protein
MAATASGGSAEPLRHVPWGELALLAALAVALRLVGLGESLWLDELFTTWVVLGPDGTLTERAALGNASPPFYWLVKWSVAAFGPGEWAVRLPTIVFGSLTPAAVYLLARAVAGSPWAGRVAGLLAALDGLCCAYGAESRPYGPVQFFGMVQLLAFWALLNGAGTRWRFCFIAATVALGYSQPTALAVIAGEILFYALLLVRGERPSYTPVRFVLDLAAAAVVLLPLVPLVLTVSGRRGNFHLSSRMVLLEDLVTYHRQTVYLLLPAVAAALVAFGRRVRAVPSTPADAQRPVLAPLFLLAVFYGTALPLWAVHRAGGPPLFTIRYTTILLLVPLVGAGLCAVRTHGWWGGVTFALVALVLGQFTEGAVRRVLVGETSLRLVHEDWRGAIREVNAHGGSAPVFIRSGFIETDGYLVSDDPLARAYLLLPVRTVYQLEPPTRPVRSLTFDGALPPGESVGLLRQAGEAWFIVKGDAGFGDRVAANARDQLTRAGTPVTITDRSVFRNVSVFRLVRVPEAR